MRRMAFVGVCSLGALAYLGAAVHNFGAALGVFDPPTSFLSNGFACLAVVIFLGSLIIDEPVV